MNKVRKLIHVLLHERGKIGLLLLPNFQRFLSDRAYVKLYYRFSMRKRLNLKNPQTFNEKLNWLKLYDHNPLYTTLVDKYAVKSWVAERIGEQYIIPTLGVWDSFDEIDFDKLPNQFVLKTTHGGGNVGVVVCSKIESFDRDAARRKLERSMKISGYEKHREWPYKNVKRRIVAEELLVDPNNISLIDYKVHVFNGTPKFILVCKGRENKTTMTDDFFDINWELMKCNRPGHKNSPTPIPKPEKLLEMLELAKKLADNIPFVRVDFYIVNNQIFFGEMTFFPAGGVKPFIPESWDSVFGSWLQLPSKL